MRFRTLPIIAIAFSSCLSPAGPAVTTTAPATATIASVSASPTTSPTPSAVPSPTTPSALLPPGAIVRTLAASELREGPSRSAVLTATIPAGEQLYIADNENQLGPITADGDAWYLVTWHAGKPAWPSQGGVDGFVAADGSGVNHLELVAVACPAGPAVTVDSLLGMAPYSRLVCFDGSDLTIGGPIITGFGGVPAPGVYQPEWLADPFGSFGALAAASGDYLLFWFPPDLSHPKLLEPIRVQVTGRFNDPVAETCVIEPETPHTSDPRIARLLCAEKFVASRIVQAAP